MEKMQKFIGFIFFEVWCNAHTEEYDIHLFEPFEPLHQIMNELNIRDLADQLNDGAGKWFYESVNEIFNEFKKLNKTEIDMYRQFFQGNNMIEELCSNDPNISPVQYRDLNPSNTHLNRKLTDFFQTLYSSGFFGLSFVRKTLNSDLSSYYNDFTTINDSGCCPFCGLLPIDNKYDPTRDAFDHYLPKSKYPFNSVNLKNLAPSCSKCNSGNKKAKDPLHDNTGKRRKAFYPFSQTPSDINIFIEVKENKWDPLTPNKLSISIKSVDFQEESVTWNDLFEIEQRYAAKCCNKNGGIHWLNRVLNENLNYKLSIPDMLVAELQSANSSPWVEANFLKKAFLEGCQRLGLFD
ncbi:MAG: hypothetical protein HGA87_02590 [Desulfobulbaceae bacterium]|nr:hypothetical protein [Desulfobulbaceae bacterium]